MVGMKGLEPLTSCSQNRRPSSGLHPDISISVSTATLPFGFVIVLDCGDDEQRGQNKQEGKGSAE